MTALLPIIIFVLIVMGVWTVLSMISQRNSRAEDRLKRFTRPASLAEMDIGSGSRLTKEQQRFSGLRKTVEEMGSVLRPTSELEQSALKVKLANAGFRSEAAPAVFLGLRLISLIFFGTLGAVLFLLLQFKWPLFNRYMWFVLMTAFGLYLPNMILWYLRSKRQEAIFLSLPDALDLLVVCVESGLGLDAAMRKVTEEMKGHAKVIAEEFSLANFQLQMGRPRREVLHDLGVRTGVDDVRSLAAILIQADRFGSSIAQALRVQSDSMRTRRRQLAEEKAAKTAVQLIFPLVMFIFPGIFIVLVGPATIQIMETLLPAMASK
ncbi:MAG: type II secretion system F family protein [Gemmataceae bacterium]|nr:type II secretion system F family protein [Gemmataceae bacterium]MDW8266434.1 type II secretion system F family protein [Gemmataceae bacterium]